MPYLPAGSVCFSTRNRARTHVCADGTHTRRTERAGREKASGQPKSIGRGVRAYTCAERLPRALLRTLRCLYAPSASFCFKCAGGSWYAELS